MEGQERADIEPGKQGSMAYQVGSRDMDRGFLGSKQKAKNASATLTPQQHI